MNLINKADIQEVKLLEKRIKFLELQELNKNLRDDLKPFLNAGYEDVSSQLVFTISYISLFPDIILDDDFEEFIVLNKF
jgi:hypothetical protein